MFFWRRKDAPAADPSDDELEAERDPAEDGRDEAAAGVALLPLDADPRLNDAAAVDNGPSASPYEGGAVGQPDATPGADWGTRDAGWAAPAEVIAPEPRKLSWSERLASGPALFQPEPDELEEPEAPDLTVRLEKSRGGFMTRLRDALGPPGAEGPSWDDVEETLIAGDVGAALAMDVVDRARRRRDPGGAEAAVRAELAALLAPRDGTWSPQPALNGGPAVVLVVGVNGTGKTTTIGKLAARYRMEGRSIILAAADTFRAAAIDQLRIWADRAGVPVVAHAPNADPGAVVYDALDAAVARGADLVIADTAGRLHTKSNLMDELTKVRRIIDKRLPGARPETLFVLDATTGQNGLAQAKAFHEAVGLTGIVLTKLDSTAKGGIVFAIEAALGVPVRFVGVGEKAGDLLPFEPDAFVAALFAA